MDAGRTGTLNVRGRDGDGMATGRRRRRKKNERSTVFLLRNFTPSSCLNTLRLNEIP